MVENVDAINKAWTIISETLTPGKTKSIHALLPEAEFQFSVQLLVQSDLGYLIEEWFLEVMQQDIRQRISPTFWQHFETTNDHKEPHERGFVAAVEFLHGVTMEYIPCIRKIESIQGLKAYRRTDVLLGTNNWTDLLIMLIKAILFHTIPCAFSKAVDDFYYNAFKVFHHVSEEEEKETDEDNVCSGCGLGTCSCLEIMSKFHTVNSNLDDIGILERVSGSAVTAIVHERIKNHVETTCKGNFETSFLETLQNWLDSKVLSWLRLVYSESRKHIYTDCISGFRGRLLHFMFEVYAKIQIDQLFNIIIEFPESEPAILDLKVCLEKTDKRSKLVASLKTALETRLLHPGVNTSDILTAYIAAIKALRVLDPAGVILELVCDPVRKYLRNRDDTVRCIVSNLTDDGSYELLDELVKGQPLLLDEGCHSDDEDEDWQKWMPDPVDADPSTTSKSRRASDIISMLVNIYGSKELFVNEYRTLLADRILTQFNYDIEKEIRYLELLKLRFGESQLHYCEVMLKDVANSKRLNTRVAETREREEQHEEIEVNAMILSAQFWPAFREEKVSLPEVLQSSLDKYTKIFEAIKGNRTLNWKPHLGLVSIEVEVKDRILNFNVSPVHAAIIMQFEKQERWTIEELGNVLQMPATALRRKIAYWQTQGLLKEDSPDTFILVEEQKGRSHDIVMPEDDEAESAMASAQSQREEELQVFWSYIVGMLTNLDCLPLERIHSMLRMFAMQGSALDCSVPELKHFLDRKVKDQKLIYSDGVYRLAKSS